MNSTPPIADRGFRGYNAARPILGHPVAQHVQNLVIREAARQRGLKFHLSVTEYVMPDCFLMLDGLLDSLPSLDGIICYSLFMLPEQTARRHAVWDRLLAAGATLIAALENQEVSTAQDVARVEALWLVRRVLPFCPTDLRG